MNHIKPNETPGSYIRLGHANCIVCGSENESGFKLDFKSRGDDSIEATFSLDERYEGYKGILHGGIIMTILDGAMTNCMFAHGYRAVTAEINVRILHPVRVREPGLVKAWIERSSSQLHILKAQVIQNQEVKARATGKFMKPAFI